MTYLEYRKQANTLWKEYLNKTEILRNKWRLKVITLEQFQAEIQKDLDYYSLSISELIDNITTWEV